MGGHDGLAVDQHCRPMRHLKAEGRSVHTMERRMLRGLNSEVSAIGAGCWTIGGAATNRGVPIGWDDVDPDAAYAGLVQAHELGVTLFDTADVYGLGRSERLLGRLLRGVRRNDLVISSKVGYFAGTARHPYHPVQMRNQFATTLDNLETDHLDVYSFHSTDFGDNDRYLAGALEIVRRLVDQGLVRAIGMRAPHVFAAERDDARRWLDLFNQIRPDVVTVRYNLLSPLDPTGQTDIFELSRHHGAGVLIKQVFGQGLLLRCRDRRYGAGDHRVADPMFTAENIRALRVRLSPIHARFGDSPTVVARLCLRYVLQHAPDAAVLVGFRDATQIDTTIRSLGDPLHDDEIAEIRSLLHPNAPTA